MRKLQKLFNIDVKSVDEANRQVTFCFSDNQEDRQGEIVDQASWDVKNFMANPVILWGHDPDEPENVLGTGVALDLNNNGKSYITAQFDDVDTNPRADMVFRQIIKRTLRCVSAGFINHTFETDDDTPVLKDNELLEISVVAIPANPRAIALGFQSGEISRKDAKWLMAGMRKEADAIEAQMKDEPESKEKSMTPEQATALLDGMTKLTERVDGLVAENTKLHEEIVALKPAEETEEEKSAREAQEAADKKAADDAEAARKAEEEAAAKDGKDDQSGAGDDEFDENAELTPEQEAALDEQFEAQMAELAPAA